jgi:hypothetical protein
MTPEYDIAMLLATRGRTDSLGRSVRSLIKLADHPDRLQLMFAFDNDDAAGTEYFKTELQPWLDEQELSYTAMQFCRLGYHRLHIYNNKLAEQTDARWLMIWNDDAVMQTQGWDTEIMNYQGQFKLLAFHTHLDHPYSIFPILPRKWYELLGYISPHPTQDGWVSQQAYMLDIYLRIPVDVLHDRFDLTGNNNDETFKNRPMLEGNHNDPRDFNHDSWRKRRVVDCVTINTYLKTIEQDTEWFCKVFDGKQDPWGKMCGPECDPNKQLSQYKTK